MNTTSSNVPDKEPFFPIEELKHLSLKEMLNKLPVIPIGNTGYGFKVNAPRLRLADGAELSVQASINHYCDPRENHANYNTVEVGYLSFVPPDSWKPYAENWETPMETVYAYVPMELVMFLIGAHGGIDVEKTFKKFKYELR
jgi:hypothetical protein